MNKEQLFETYPDLPDDVVSFINDNDAQINDQSAQINDRSAQIKMLTDTAQELERLINSMPPSHDGWRKPGDNSKVAAKDDFKDESGSDPESDVAQTDVPAAEKQKPAETEPSKEKVSKNRRLRQTQL